MVKIKDWYRILDAKSNGVVGILPEAIGTYSRKRATASAASVAYYTFFSLFPLLLVLIAIGSFFLDRVEIYQYLQHIIQMAVPVSTNLVTENLDHLIEARGPVGLVGLLTLLWSASGMFSGLAGSIQQAWPRDSRRSFVQVRLIGVGIVVAMSALLVLSLLLRGLLSLSPLLDRENGSILTQDIWSSLINLGSWLTMILLFTALYRGIPSADISWTATLWSSCVATLAWRVAIRGFTWYISSGLGQYQLVYGTLGAIVALLFLIYILANITLFGAHLCAAIDRWHKKNLPGEAGTGE